MDAKARAQEICTAHIRAPWSTDDYHLRDAIAAALRAERERALEEAEMAVSGYVAIAAGPKHVEGLRKLFRALKERKP